MTTAVAPRNAKSWGDFFEGYPEQGQHWSVINSFLEAYAMLGRFGWKDEPHDFKQNQWTDEDECSRCDRPKSQHPYELPLDDMVMLANYHSYKKAFDEEHSDFSKFDPIKLLDVLTAAHKSKAKVKKIVYDDNMFTAIKFGLWLYFLTKIGTAEPVVGHFVGRGFDQNEKDANRFLGVEVNDGD